MKLSEALKIIIIELALKKCNHNINMKQSISYQLDDMIEYLDDLNSDKGKALLIWFGTYDVSKEILDKFKNIYSDWVESIYINIPSIIQGKITFEEVIFDHITKTTWP